MRPFLAACAFLLISIPAFATGSCGWVLVDATFVESCGPTWIGCDTQWTYYYEYICDGTTGGGGTGGGGGGGTGSPNPPNLNIVSISDENPENPVLTISSSNLSGMDLFIGGTYRNSYGASTTSIILPSLRTFADYSTAVCVQGYGTDGTAVQTCANVTRPADVKRGSAVLVIHYVMESAGPVPLDENVTYINTVDDLVGYTNYDVSTVGSRNGRVQQHQSEHTIHIYAEDDIFGYDSSFHIESLRALNDWIERTCYFPIADGHPFHSSQCSDEIGEFTRDGSSAISTLGSPGRFGELGYDFVQGQTINITP